jgi:DNA-binding NtrC family response regulator
MPIRWHPHLPICRPDFQNNGFRPIFHTAHTMAALQNYPWPGNVRELENVIERAMITTRGATLRLMETLAMPQAPPVDITRRKTLEEVEIDYIVQTLEATRWRIEGQDGAAAILGLNPSTLRGRMQKHGIYRPLGWHRR